MSIFDRLIRERTQNSPVGYRLPYFTPVTKANATEAEYLYCTDRAFYDQVNAELNKLGRMLYPLD